VLEVTPNAQNAVKIVSFIFPVIYDKPNLRADVLFAQIYLRNPHLPAPKCSTHGGVNEQPFKLGALMARVTETVKERTFHLQRMQECYRK
jgi:hypothetical protein